AGPCRACWRSAPRAPVARTRWVPAHPRRRPGTFHPLRPGSGRRASLASGVSHQRPDRRRTPAMWRLSVLPSKESNLSPVDVVVAAEPDGSIADLAAELGAHLGGGHRHLLLAPTTDGRPWPASRRLADTGLHDG